MGRVHLSGGRGPHEGNVEVEVGGVWGFICDDGFGFREADLLCRDLGYEHAETFTRNNHFGANTAEWRRSSVRFWLDRLNCSPDDISFRNCSSRGLGLHDCGPTEVAGVVCRRPESQCEPQLFPCASSSSSSCISRDRVCDQTPDCSDNSDEAAELCQDVGVTRLRSNTALNIPGATVGTVFVKHQQEWGTVCDDNFFATDAKVLCRNLGYGSGWTVAFAQAYLGQGQGKIWLQEPGCRGNEEWLGQCPGSDWDVTNCEHREDLAVFCYDGGMEVRLKGGRTQSSGQLEVKLGGKWGTICHTRFDDLDAQVACRMLGYHGQAQAQRVVGRGPGPMWRLLLDCLGTEKDLQGCRIRLNNGTCSSTGMAGVTCSHSGGQLDSALRSLLPADCGQPEDASRQFLTKLAKVRSGKVPSRFDAPWLVSLRSAREEGGRLTCGGSIISEDYVITAAHCLRYVGRLNLVVRVGDYNSNFDEDSEEDYFIDKVWQHEEFDRLSFNDNDIALLKVQRKNGRGIRFGPRVRPICLPRVGDDYDDLESCTVIGWGPTFYLGKPVARPSEAQVRIVADHLCEEQFTGGARNFTSSFVCAGDPANFVNSCKGDSGGPLACRVNGRSTLYGMVSSGFSCSLVRSPDSFTRVTKYLRWLYEKLAPGRSSLL